MKTIKIIVEIDGLDVCRVFQLNDINDHDWNTTVADMVDSLESNND